MGVDEPVHVVIAEREESLAGELGAWNRLGQGGSDRGGVADRVVAVAKVLDRVAVGEHGAGGLQANAFGLVAPVRQDAVAKAGLGAIAEDIVVKLREVAALPVRAMPGDG